MSDQHSTSASPRSAPPPDAPRGTVIDLTESGELEALIRSLTERLLVTPEQVQDYRSIAVALRTSAHRSQQLVERVFDDLSAKEQSRELHLV